MRTHKKKTQPSRPTSRTLKIHPHHRTNRWSTATVPEIRLAGNWLEELGFVPRQRVHITTMKKLLIIRVEE